MSTTSQLVIHRCTDSLLWYWHLVGRCVPLIRDLPSECCWLAREPSGFSNIVRHTDALLLPDHHVLVPPEQLMQRGDRMHAPHGWSLVPMSMWGTPINTQLVIRQHTRHSLAD